MSLFALCFQIGWKQVIVQLPGSGSNGSGPPEGFVVIKVLYFLLVLCVESKRSYTETVDSYKTVNSDVFPP